MTKTKDNKRTRKYKSVREALLKQFNRDPRPTFDDTLKATRINHHNVGAVIPVELCKFFKNHSFHI